MRIEATCTTCRQLVASADKWSCAVTHAALHEHQPVRVVGVMTRDEWKRLHPDYKASRLPGRIERQRAVLHLDSDGSTILVPVEVR